MELSNLLQGIFGKKPRRTTHPVTRTDAEKGAYSDWKGTPKSTSLKSWLMSEYTYYEVHKHPHDESVRFLCCPESRGFSWYSDPGRWTSEEFTYMFDWLSERTIALGYHVDQNIVEINDFGDISEEVQRTRLRPNGASSSDEVFDQRYGQILILLHRQNGKSINISYSATAFGGRHKCNEVGNFGELMTYLLKGQ